MANIEKQRWTLRIVRVLKWVLLSFVGLVVAMTVTVLVIANSQNGTIKVLQSVLYMMWGTEPNSFQPATPKRDVVLGSGVRARTNIKYGDTYPNSYLDIWYPTADIHVGRPTVIFIHGGGWFAGSKDLGDPLAGGNQAQAGDFIESLAKAGLNLVNLDYALAPAYQYPVQMIQLNEAIRFLREHSDEHGVDMTNVIIMGGSAGAHMTAQYGALLSDPAYAADVGIKPAIDPADVKGLVVFSAPLKVSGFGWRMNAISWAYLGTKDLENSKQAQQCDILSKINPRYPATYITDGNQADTFPEHAKSMVRLLRENNVEHVFNFYETSEAPLGHTYTGQLDTKYGRDNFDKAIMFMKQRTGLR